MTNIIKASFFSLAFLSSFASEVYLKQIQLEQNMYKKLGLSLQEQARLKAQSDIKNILARLGENAAESAIGAKSGITYEMALEELKNISNPALRKRLGELVDRHYLGRSSLTESLQEISELEELLIENYEEEVRLEREYMEKVLTKGVDNSEQTTTKGNVRFPSHPRTEYNTSVGSSKSAGFEAGVKLSFLGAEFRAGPRVKFEQQYSVKLMLIRGGTDSIQKFDPQLGYTILNHSDDVPLVYLCTADSSASHKLTAGAKLSFSFVGGEVEANNWQSLRVQKSSQLASAPLSIIENGIERRTTLRDIHNICHEQFVKNLRPQLDYELKLLASSLVYRNSHNQCGHDAHCAGMHKRLLPYIRSYTKGVCQTTESGGVPLNLCAIQGVENMVCSVYDENKKRISQGYLEYPCAKPYKCTVVKKAGWFKRGHIYAPAVAKCL